jgi:hypothetical protein
MAVDELYKRTTLIRYQLGDVDFAASGFFWKSSDEVYLITNRHIIEHEFGISPESLEVYFRKQTDPKSTERKQINLDSDKSDNFLTLDEYPSADITAIPLLDINFDKVGNAAFTADDVISREENNIPLGAGAMIVGYPSPESPGGRPIRNKEITSPVAISGLISSQFGNYFDNDPMFLADAQTYDGLSGSPVLLQPGTALFDSDAGQINYLSAANALLGVHSGHYAVSTDVSLNRIWYADLIADLIEKGSS